jgi:hypothetical protein
MVYTLKDGDDDDDDGGGGEIHETQCETDSD